MGKSIIKINNNGNLIDIIGEIYNGYGIYKDLTLKNTYKVVLLNGEFIGIEVLFTNKLKDAKSAIDEINKIIKVEDMEKKSFNDSLKKDILRIKDWYSYKM